MMMAVFALKVETTERDSRGVRVQPGIPAEAFRDRPLLKTMIQGATFELRRPDGTVIRTRLVTHGIGLQLAADGRLLVAGPLTEQPIVLTFDADLADGDIPPGTEIWYVPEPERGAC